MKFLIHSVECKASDIHLSVGRAPNYRIDGALHIKGEERLMPDDVKKLITPLLDERHAKELTGKWGRQTLLMRFLVWDDSV